MLDLIMLVVTLALFVTGGILWIRRHDRFEPEPWWMLLIAVAIGGGLMWLSVVMQQRLIIATSPRLDGPWACAAIPGVGEELAKLLAVILIAIFVRRHFNDPMDGMAYGAAAGVGAAAWEVLAVEGSAARTFGVSADLPGVMAIRIVLHLLFGALAAGGIGWFLVDRWRGLIVAPTAFAVAAGLHTGWDRLVATELPQRSIAALAVILFLVTIALNVSLLIATLIQSRRHLGVEDQPLLPAPWDRIGQPKPVSSPIEPDTEDA